MSFKISFFNLIAIFLFDLVIKIINIPLNKYMIIGNIHAFMTKLLLKILLRWS